MENPQQRPGRDDGCLKVETEVVDLLGCRTIFDGAETTHDDVVV
jgi:hypothetical protein